jgi:hypothetical protein
VRAGDRLATKSRSEGVKTRNLKRAGIKKVKKIIIRSSK